MKYLDPQAIFLLLERMPTRKLSDEEIDKFYSRMLKNASDDMLKLFAYCYVRIGEIFEEPSKDFKEETDIYLCNARLSEFIAIMTIMSPEVEKAFFRSDKIIDYADCYNIAYFHECLSICPPQYDEFIELISKEIESISLEKIISYEEDIETSISEWDFYEMLEKMTPKETSQIIETIEVDRLKKNTLKKYILEKDPDNFVNIILLNSIEFDRAAWIAQIWYCIVLLKKLLTISSKIDAFSKEHVISILHSLIEDKHLYLDKQPLVDKQSVRSIFDMIEYAENLPSKPLQIENIDYHMIYNNINQILSISIYLHHNFLHLTTNIENTKQVQKYISMWEYTRNLEEAILNKKINLIEHTYSCKVLEVFKDKFMIDLVIPESIKRKKIAEDFFCESGLTTDECRQLYDRLTAAELLSRDNETYFSFLYRMSFDYTPERSNPSPIIWKGKPRELFSLIWNYHQNTTKIWEKTRNYFLDSNGEPLKINGVKNQIKSKTARMEKILNDIK